MPPIHSVTKGRSQHLTIMIYADPGVGKTVFAGSSPGRVLILRPPHDHTDSISNPDVKEWVIHDHSELDDALLYLRHDGSDEFDWVWFDSISLWQDVGLDDVWDAAVRRKPDRKNFDVDKGEYGINMNRLSRWIRHMAGTPHFNFGITAHPQILPIAEHDEAEDKLMPWIQGKNMSPKICGYCNVVGYMVTLKGGTRRLRLNSGERWYAKEATGCNLAPKGYIDNPTMPKLLANYKAPPAATDGTSARPARRTRRTHRTTTRRGAR